jgi:colanic acid/amylovoran biosynthesis glycosyltransferase
MKKKIAYILSRFPTVSETFILYEMIELGRLGVEIEIFPLIHEIGPVTHPEVNALLPRVHYARYFSPDTIRDHLFWLRKKPKTYFETMLRVIAKNFWSPKFLSRAIVVLLLSARTARKIEQLDIELIHAHSATHPTLMAYIVCSLTGIPYSFTAHSSDIYFNQTMLGEKIEHASFVATISEYNRAFLKSIHPNIPTDKIKVIHCGIDPAKFQKNHVERSSKSLTIICVGRLEKVKGQKYLIETCAQLKERNIDFRCYLVGDGELQSQIQRQINQLDLADFVKILGFQPHHKVVDLLRQADILVLPSISEGIPVAIMEAMASGIPVVATSVTGVPELVEDSVTGLLVPSRNSSALTDAILRLYKSPELRLQMGESGRQKVFKDFNLQRSAVMLQNSFQKV